MVEALKPSKKVVRLLVIHESKLYGDLIKEHAELLGHEYRIECRCASTHTEVSTLMQGWLPTVVLLDAYSTTVDSVKFLDSWGQGASRIFVVSDFLSADIREAMLSRGAAEYVTKSEAPEELECLLERVVTISPEALALH